MLCLVISGCNGLSDGGATTENMTLLIDDSAAVTSGVAKSVSFNLVMPDTAAANKHNLRAAAEEPEITFTLTIINSNTGKVHSLIKVAKVKNGSASFVFSGVPAYPVLAQLRIRGGNYQGYNELHGASDLQENADNVIDISPRGCGLPADKLAQVFAEVIKSEEMIRKTTPGTITAVKEIIAEVEDPSQINIEVVVDFIDNSKGRMFGKIIDAAGAPIAGAAVRVVGSEIYTITDAEGRFEITDMAPGTYDLIVARDGYVIQTFSEIKVL
jgi:hypothetical protein